MTCDKYYNIVHTDVENEKTHELHVTNRECLFFDQYIETACISTLPEIIDIAKDFKVHKKG